VNADTDAREVAPSGVGTHQRGGALRILSAALAMAEGTACVESAGEAEKAIAAKSEALEPGAYDKAGRRERPPQGRARHGVETSPREGEWEGYVRTRGKKRPSEGHSPLKTAEEGIRQDTKESERVRATRPLETAEKRTWNESDVMRARAGDSRGRDSSEHGKKAME